MCYLITRPSKQQVLLFKAVNRELKMRAGDALSDEERFIIVSNFVSSYDFSNTALGHKSAGGWADMIISELG
jgi:hypothetical protein